MKKLIITMLFSISLLITNAQSIDPAYVYLISSAAGSNLNLTVSGDTLITKAKNKVNNWAIINLDTSDNSCMLLSADGYYLSNSSAGVLKAKKGSGTTWILNLDNNLAGTITSTYEDTVYYLEYEEDGSVSLSSSASGGNTQKWKFNSAGKKPTN